MILLHREYCEILNEELVSLGRQRSCLKAQYDQKEKHAADATQADWDLRAVLGSLRLVIEFLDKAQGPRGDDDPSFALRRLAVALYNIQDGATDEMLLPRRADGRPRNPAGLSYAQGWCAAAVEILMRKGKKKKAACEFVFRRLGPNWVSTFTGASSHSAPDWKAVAHWRDKASSAMASSDIGQSYSEGLQFFKYPDGNLDEFIGKQLKVLKEKLSRVVGVSASSAVNGSVDDAGGCSAR